MANVYESKFKGVEVDKGVNIALNLTGAGGIEVKTAGTGIDTVKTIDGSGVKITPVQSTGTSTTDVMSQKAVTEALSGKQDELTWSSIVSVGTVNASNLSCANFEVTGSPVNIGTEGSSVIALKGSKIDISGSTGIDFYGGGYQFNGGGVTFSDGITVNKYSSLNGIYVDNSTTNPICFKRNNSIVTKMFGPTSGGGELVNIYLPGKAGTLAVTDQYGNLEITGSVSTSNLLIMETPNSDKYVSLDSDWLARYEARQGDDPEVGDSSTRILWPYVSGTGAYDFSIKIPAKSGTIALTDDVGVTSISGKTGAITLSTGLAMSGNQLVNKVKDIYTQDGYLCIDTN